VHQNQVGAIELLVYRLVVRVSCGVVYYITCNWLVKRIKLSHHKG